MKMSPQQQQQKLPENKADDSGISDNNMSSGDDHSDSPSSTARSSPVGSTLLDQHQQLCDTLSSIQLTNDSSKPPTIYNSQMIAPHANHFIPNASSTSCRLTATCQRLCPSYSTSPASNNISYQQYSHQIPLDSSTHFPQSHLHNGFNFQQIHFPQSIHYKHAPVPHMAAATVSYEIPQQSFAPSLQFPTQFVQPELAILNNTTPSLMPTVLAQHTLLPSSQALFSPNNTCMVQSFQTPPSEYSPPPHTFLNSVSSTVYQPPYCSFPPPPVLPINEYQTDFDFTEADAQSLSQRMDLVWNSSFAKLFTLFPQPWVLQPTFEAVQETNWIMHVDHAKVRFLCQECAAGWTSMKGRVAFWIRFDQVQGIVRFKLYGQTCKRCEERAAEKPSATHKPLEFQHSMWYIEEVEKVLHNLYYYIGRLYYGFAPNSKRKDCRPGKPRKPHNKDLCQACQDGVCGASRQYTTNV